MTLLKPSLKDIYSPIDKELAMFSAMLEKELSSEDILISQIHTHLLKMTGKVFFGPQDERWNGMADLNMQERVISVVLIALLFGVGVLPSALVNLSNSTVTHLVKYFS